MVKPQVYTSSHDLLIAWAWDIALPDSALTHSHEHIVQPRSSLTNIAEGSDNNSGMIICLRGLHIDCNCLVLAHLDSCCHCLQSQYTDTGSESNTSTAWPYGLIAMAMMIHLTGLIAHQKYDQAKVLILAIMYLSWSTNLNRKFFKVAWFG